MSESQTALILKLKGANNNFPRVRKRSRIEKFGHFLWTEKLFFFDQETLSGNSEARRTEIMSIIQYWGIGFQDNKNLSSILIFEGNI